MVEEESTSGATYIEVVIGVTLCKQYVSRLFAVMSLLSAQ